VGDIVASESHNGTLKTILTRSRNRGEIYAGKVLATLTYTLLVLLATGAVGVISASIEWGFNPLTSLSGTTLSADQSTLIPAAAVTPIHNALLRVGRSTSSTGTPAGAAAMKAPNESGMGVVSPERVAS